MSARELKQLLSGNGFSGDRVVPGSTRQTRRPPLRLDPSEDPGLADALRRSVQDMEDRLYRERKEAEAQGLLSPSRVGAPPVGPPFAPTSSATVLPPGSVAAVPTDSSARFFSQPPVVSPLAAPALTYAPAGSVPASVPAQHSDGVSAAEFAQLVSAVAALSSAIKSQSRPQRHQKTSVLQQLANLSGYPGDLDNGDSTDEDGDDDATGPALGGSATTPRSGRPPRTPDIVAQALAGVADYGSFSRWVQQQHFSKTRNLREAESWAKVLDLLVQGPMFVTAALEAAVRRLAGVHLADQCGSNWALAEAVEQRSAKNSFLSQTTVNGVFKLAERLEKVQKQAARDTSAGSSFGSGNRANQRVWSTNNVSSQSSQAGQPQPAPGRTNPSSGFAVGRYTQGSQQVRSAQAPGNQGSSAVPRTGASGAGGQQ